jgi:bacteriocin-type transport-associated protein
MKKALFFLSVLDDSDVEWLIVTGVKRAVPQGTTLIHFGKQVDSLFMVLEGMFRVQTNHGDARELARLSSGEILGEMSFVDSRPPSATVIALTESSVLAVDRAELRMKLDEDVGFAARFYKAIAMLLSDRLRSTVSHLGYGSELELDENIEDKDEVSSDMLETMALAGNRFVELQRRVRGIAAGR